MAFPKGKDYVLARLSLLNDFEDLCFKAMNRNTRPTWAELISDHKLRAELNLSDGDPIEFALV